MLDADRNGLPPLRAILTIDRERRIGLLEILVKTLYAENFVWPMYPASDYDCPFVRPPVTIVHGSSAGPFDLARLWDTHLAEPLKRVDERAAGIISALRRNLRLGTWKASALIGPDPQRGLIDPSLWNNTDRDLSFFAAWASGRMRIGGIDYRNIRLWPSAGIPLGAAPLYVGDWRHIEETFRIEAAVADDGLLGDLADMLGNGIFQADSSKGNGGKRRLIPAAEWEGANRAKLYARPDVRIHLWGIPEDIATPAGKGNNSNPEPKPESIPEIWDAIGCGLIALKRAKSKISIHSITRKNIDGILRSVLTEAAKKNGIDIDKDIEMFDIIQECTPKGNSTVNDFLNAIQNQSKLPHNKNPPKTHTLHLSEKKILLVELVSRCFSPKSIPLKDESEYLIADFIDDMMGWCVINLPGHPFTPKADGLGIQIQDDVQTHPLRDEVERIIKQVAYEPIEGMLTPEFFERLRSREAPETRGAQGRPPDAGLTHLR